MTTTVVLTSRQNFVWHSMQEIIPSIEELWSATSTPGRHEVHVVDVDQEKFDVSLPKLLRAKNIVIACFTTSIARFAVALRSKIGIDARFFIYVHGQASLACWPIREWGLGSVLRSSDVFISSCRLDAQTLELSFRQAHVEVIPFTFPGDRPSPKLFRPKEHPSGKETRFLFIGRISPQKNLHVIIEALNLLKKSSPERSFELHFFGEEDNYGRPNFGIESPEYGAHLLKLVAQFNLESNVFFRGHVSREELDRELSERPAVFISPSVHSDENFGMAAFRALCLGLPAVLSAWGGHVDFGEQFQDRVFYCLVYGGLEGPVVLATDLAKQMEVAAAQELRSGSEIPAAYRPETITTKLLALAESGVPVSSPLIFSSLADRIWENRRRFLAESPRRSKIFASLSDPDARLLFRGYGMRG